MAASVTFQSQNPTKSGDHSTYVDALGHKKFVSWANCTAYVAAMGAEFSSGVKISGADVRRQSSEPAPDPKSPGLNLSQVAHVLKKHGVKLDVQAPIAFDDLDELRRAGHAIALQLSYASLQHTKFSGDPAFNGGHIVLWLPNGDVYDPLDDGRRKGIAQAPVRIPVDLLRRAAGELVLDAKGRTVGAGRAYAGVFLKRHPAPIPAGTDDNPVHLTFGSEPKARGSYEVVVGTALVRSSPGGVPGRANVVDRKRQGAVVHVFGTTRRGQRVGGSRMWHQINRAGTRFMHSSVIDPVDEGE
jgi:hypothetical protein